MSKRVETWYESTVAKCLQKEGVGGWFTVTMETVGVLKGAKKCIFHNFFPSKLGLKIFKKSVVDVSGTNLPNLKILAFQ